MMPCMNDLKNISSLVLRQGNQHPLIQNEKPEFFVLVDQLLVTAFISSNSKFDKQIRKSYVLNGQELLTSGDTEGTGDVRFAGTCCSHDDDIVMVIDVLTGGKP